MRRPGSADYVRVQRQTRGRTGGIMGGAGANLAPVHVVEVTDAYKSARNGTTATVYIVSTGRIPDS